MVDSKKLERIPLEFSNMIIKYIKVNMKFHLTKKTKYVDTKQKKIKQISF